MPHSHQHQLAFEIRNSANWIAVASAEHVCIGQAAGFMQVCHGKSAPLRRIHAGDRVAYYSPTQTFRGRDTLQAFTAMGIVTSATPHQAEIEGGFRPFRHNVAWLDSAIAPIAPLLHDLEFPEGRANWGAKLRFGLVKISADDMATIARAMQAAFSEPADQNGRLKTRLGTSSPASTWPNATGMPPQAA